MNQKTPLGSNPEDNKPQESKVKEDVEIPTVKQKKEDTIQNLTDIINNNRHITTIDIDIKPKGIALVGPKDVFILTIKPVDTNHIEALTRMLQGYVDSSIAIAEGRIKAPWKMDHLIKKVDEK